MRIIKLKESKKNSCGLAEWYALVNNNDHRNILMNKMNNYGIMLTGKYK
ncbi:MAG: hypothetical protein ACLFN1_07330 [Bacteroidales bacterium]